MIPRLHRRVALVVAVGLTCYAPAALPSYAQMTLPGLGGMFMLALMVAYAILIDIVLLFRAFRFRPVLIVGTLISLALTVGLATQPKEFKAFFDTIDHDWEENLARASLVLVPLTFLAAPVVQYFESRRHWPYRAAYVAIAVQAALFAIERTMTYLDDHPLESTHAEWLALHERGQQVKPGEIPVLRDEFEKRHAWGSDYSHQLLKGIDDSALIHGNASLPPEDRKALSAMLERDRSAARPRVALFHYYGFIATKLQWDTLEPGRMDRRFPYGTTEYVHPKIMLEYIDLHGPQHLCSVDGLAKTDRVALFRALIARGFNTPETAAPINRSLDRLDEACRAAGTAPRP